MSELPYINLGCGSTFNPRWTNVDFITTGEGVIACNLIKGIPFNDSSFKVVYHSHILEHFTKPDGEKFTSECYRILEPGGIIRIAVPDLEAIARNYIKYMEACLAHDVQATEKYNWTLLEMYDQTVRSRVGGEMLDYIKDENRRNDAFLIERNGNETRQLINNLRKKEVTNEHLINRGFSFAGFKSKVKNKLVSLLLKDDVKALEMGRFRLSGEIHQWMYDRYSLAQLLKKFGFVDPKVVSASESAIEGWNSFNLDRLDDSTRKPDSLFMEAKKPK